MEPPWRGLTEVTMGLVGWEADAESRPPIGVTCDLRVDTSAGLATRVGVAPASGSVMLCRLRDLQKALVAWPLRGDKGVEPFFASSTFSDFIALGVRRED